MIPEETEETEETYDEIAAVLTAEATAEAARLGEDALVRMDACE